MTATHYPSSRGSIAITAMPGLHLVNAIAKMEREGREADPVYSALIAERDSRPADYVPPREVKAGDNAPPPISDYEAAKERIEDLLIEARNWLDGAPVETQAQADEVGRLMDSLRTAHRHADAARKVEAKPFDDGKAEVQGRYNPLLKRASDAVDGAKATVGRFLQAQERKRREEADRLRREADEAARAAREAAEAAAPDDLTSVEHREEAATFARELERDAKRAAEARPQAAGGRRAVSLRTYWFPVITDENAALRHIWLTDREAVKAFALEWAKREVASGKRQMPGFDVQSEERAV